MFGLSGFHNRGSSKNDSLKSIAFALPRRDDNGAESLNYHSVVMLFDSSLEKDICPSIDEEANAG